MYELVAFSPEAGLMSVFVGGHAYLLDKDDLAIVGAVLLRLLADGHHVTPTMIPAILHREPKWT